MKKLVIINILFLAFGLISYSQTYNIDKKLYFENGMFNIVQFTDLHWTHRSNGCQTTRKTIETILQNNKVGLAVLTGDVVTASPAAPGWKAIVDIFNHSKTPFVVVLGNHDAECMSKDSIYNILLSSPFYVGTKGPKNIFGMGNCAIPIYSKQNNKAEVVLYFIDSNDYRANKNYGEYDWVHSDQINWYRQESSYFTKLNGGTPLPSLAFFHIPLLEWNNVVDNKSTFGNKNEVPVASPKVNSGLFEAFITSGDVMGAFVGHDHNNDFIGIEYGIALGFGRCTGADAYGNLSRGGRIIQLYEGQRKFDTYIVTPNGAQNYFYYPSAINSLEETTMEYLPSVNIKPQKRGLNYNYYEGKIRSTQQIKNLHKTSHGFMPNFNITNSPAKDHFAYEFSGYIYVPTKGVYNFYTFSDDGSKLFIDNKLVVDNDGGHSAKKVVGKIALQAGYHKIKLLYFENYMGQYLEVGYSSKNITECPIPDAVLFAN